MNDGSSSRSSRLPQALDRRGFYYGWVVLLAGTVGIVMSVPGQTMGVSVYTEHLLRSLGVSRVGLSMAYMFGTLLSSFLLPFVGRLLDTIGSRVVATGASLALAFCLVFLSVSPAVEQWLVGVTHLDRDWVGLFVVFVGFLGIRHFGQGQLTVSSRTMMGRWFERKRGLMLGISGLFVAFAFGAAPLVLNTLIVRFTWERSLWILAAVLVVAAAFMWTTFRQSPESCGLMIDGGRYATEESSLLPQPEESSYTANEARRTLTFWAFNLGLAAVSMMMSAVIFNMGRIAELSHRSNAVAFSVFLPLGIISTCSELSSGVISDRIPLKYLLAVMQVGILLGLIGVHTFRTETGFVLTAVGFGIANGLFSLLTAAAWPKLFGREHLGAIAGLNMSWIVAGSSIGPYLLNVGDKYLGNYQLALALMMLIPTTVLLLSFRADQPPRHVVVEEVEPV